MSAAGYWLAVCGTRCHAGYSSLATDPWCQRLLSEVSGPAHIEVRNPDAFYMPEPVGRDGRKYLFDDGSALLLNSDVAVVL